MKIGLWLLILGLVGGGYYAYQQGYVSSYINQYAPPSVAQHLPSVITISEPNAESAPKLDQDSQAQIEEFARRASILSTQTQQVLGDSIAVNEEAQAKETSLQQAAIDRGLYLYCQQYVEQYEAAQEAAE